MEIATTESGNHVMENFTALIHEMAETTSARIFDVVLNGTMQAIFNQMENGTTEEMFDSMDNNKALEDSLNLNESNAEIKEGNIEELQEVKHSSLLAIYLIISIVGILGNGLVILVITRSRTIQHTFTSLYIIHQSVVDLVTGIVLGLSSLTVRNYDLSQVPPFLSDLFCRVWLSRSLLWCTLTTSTYSLIAITAERYMKIVFPIKHRTHFSRRVQGVTILISWFIGLVLNVSNNAATSAVVNGRCFPMINWYSVLAQKISGILSICILFILPILTFIIMYGHIIYILYNPRMPANNRQPTTKKTIKLLCCVVVCFFVCWVLNSMLFLLFNLGMWLDFDSALYHVSTIMVFLNSCINPVIYAAHYKPFRQNFKAMFCTGRVQPADVNTSGFDTGVGSSHMQVLPASTCSAAVDTETAAAESTAATV